MAKIKFGALFGIKSARARLNFPRRDLEDKTGFSKNNNEALHCFEAENNPQNISSG